MSCLLVGSCSDIQHITHSPRLSLPQGFTWPVFKWAGGADDKYFAKIGKNAISIYEARPSRSGMRAALLLRRCRVRR